MSDRHIDDFPVVDMTLLSDQDLAKIKANTALAPPLPMAAKVALARIFAGGSAQLVPLDDDAFADSGTAITWQQSEPA